MMFWVSRNVVFVPTVKANAWSIDFNHNHPWGNLPHSNPDKRLTRRLVGIGVGLGSSGIKPYQLMIYGVLPLS